MSKRNDFVNKTSELKTNHLIEQNKEHIPAMLKFAMSLKKEYLETKAAEGLATAILCAYHTIDTLQAEAIARSPYTVSCIGCTAAYCCHQNVEICETEAQVIAQYCKEEKIPIPRKYLQEQLVYSRQNITSAGCSACVFLKDNRCSIYKVRPINCRTYHVASPREHCDTKNHKSGRVATLPITAAELIGNVLFDEGGKIGRMPRMLIKYSR